MVERIFDVLLTSERHYVVDEKKLDELDRLISQLSFALSEMAFITYRTELNVEPSKYDLLDKQYTKFRDMQCALIEIRTIIRLKKKDGMTIKEILEHFEKYCASMYDKLKSLILSAIAEDYLILSENA